MPTLTAYDSKDPDPFLTEARAQVAEASKRGRECGLNLAGSIFWFALWCAGVWPWPTFILSVYLGVCAVINFEGWLVARQAASIALGFRIGIEQ
jgi:hypothetical protein